MPDQPNLFDFAPAPETLRATTPVVSSLRIGTSSFSAVGWESAFYPAGLKDADRLTYYATRFNTVEVDSTFYRTPAQTTVRNWYAKTPPGFVFALKAPQVVTHDKVLLDSEPEFDEFIRAAGELQEKLGVILLQFPYFNSWAFRSQAEFIARLKPFFAKLPQDLKFAVEIRNKHWINARYLDLLHEYGVGAALVDQSFVPRPWEFKSTLDWGTADFAYVRLLGDRKEIETRTKTWNRVILDRTQELRSWVDYLRPTSHRGETIYVYANNHYAGFGPATADSFLELWSK